jgi:hypothetical protein
VQDFQDLGPGFELEVTLRMNGKATKIWSRECIVILLESYCIVTLN